MLLHPDFGQFWDLLALAVIGRMTLGATCFTLDLGGIEGGQGTYGPELKLSQGWLSSE